MPSPAPWTEVHVYHRRSLRDPESHPGVANPHTNVDVDFSPRLLRKAGSLRSSEEFSDWGSRYGHPSTAAPQSAAPRRDRQAPAPRDRRSAPGDDDLGHRRRSYAGSPE